MKKLSFVPLAATMLLIVVPHITKAQQIVYETTFDNLTAMQTQPSPGANNQGGWYRELARGGGFGEIQGLVAKSGLALHEFTPATNPLGLQTIDKRRVSSVDVSEATNVTLALDFYATTSDRQKTNIYDASFTASGGPFPGFQIIGVNLFSGNGSVKDAIGVNIGLGTFNGRDNNEPLHPSVGRHLTWDAWHSMTLVINQKLDHYSSITIDGETQDLSNYLLPRSFYNGAALRGQLIEELNAQVVAGPLSGQGTSDSVYWDNVRLTATSVPEPGTFALLMSTISVSLLLRRRRK